MRFNIASLIKESDAPSIQTYSDKYAIIIYLPCNKLFDATSTFTAFIDSSSCHSEIGHVIFVKLFDFLGCESINRGRSFSHIIFRMPVTFPHEKRRKKIRGENHHGKIASDNLKRAAARERLFNCESISTRIINTLRT